MGRWPTRDDENQCRPRESGDPSFVRNTMDSRFRGTDEIGVIFRGASRDAPCGYPVRKQPHTTGGHKGRPYVRFAAEANSRRRSATLFT